MGDFIPQNPSLGTRFQTPSSHYELHIPKKTAVAKRQRSQGQGNKVPLWGLGQSPNRSPNRP